jgi:cytochrome c553
MRTMLLFIGLAFAAGVQPAVYGSGVTAAAIGTQENRPDAAQVRYMRAHLSQAMVLHAAIIRGDLPAVGPAALALATLDDSQFPAGAPEAVAAMKAAARRAANAKDVLEAARSTAELLSACGNCHRTIGTRPAILPTSRPQLGGIVGHMLEHQGAVDQLLEGLVIPSDTLWRAGARALMAAPLNPRDLPLDSNARRQLAPTEERVHRLATEAIQATDPEARAGFYGQVLAGCADCHRLHAKLWGPKPK